jgi:hypothetical protein
MRTAPVVGGLVRHRAAAAAAGSGPAGRLPHEPGDPLVVDRHTSPAFSSAGTRGQPWLPRESVWICLMCLPSNSLSVPAVRPDATATCSSRSGTPLAGRRDVDSVRGEFVDQPEATWEGVLPSEIGSCPLEDLILQLKLAILAAQLSQFRSLWNRALLPFSSASACTIQSSADTTC